MSPDQFTFDFSSGKDYRDAGIEKVNEHTPAWWINKCRYTIADLAESGREFHAEDVRELCGDPPNNPNAFSAQFMWAVKAKIIYWTGKIVPTARQSSHQRGGGLKVYRGVKR